MTVVTSPSPLCTVTVAGTDLEILECTVVDQDQLTLC